MSVAEVLAELGGVATRAALISATSRAEVDRCLAEGLVEVLTRGRYALAGADQARVTAHRLAGVLSHTSAAIHHGWAVALTPERPHVTFARNRKLTDAQRAGIEVHRADLGPDDVLHGMTSRERTLVDCLRSCSEADGLAVADSALRDGMARRALVALARDVRGPGSTRVRELAGAADVDAANGFESALRSIARTVPGLQVQPQVSIRTGDTWLGRPDLVDEALGIIIEADSFEWHGDRAALARDTRRYNAFAVNGWLVLRFAWEDVMFRPEQVRATLVAAVAERTQGHSGRSPAA